ncbi:MAG: DUF434 domain-containing protein [Chitinophagales bacterium]|nr:DUF434 domain-containing protein [Chitinophagales bacterium]MBP9220142.1 DUF434 domain-containing protein [Chitinophagales bacterium]
MVFKAFQYFLGRGLPVKISITSITEKYHFSASSSQWVRTCFCSNSFIMFFFID